MSYPNISRSEKEKTLLQIPLKILFKVMLKILFTLKTKKKKTEAAHFFYYIKSLISQDFQLVQPTASPS